MSACLSGVNVTLLMIFVFWRPQLQMEKLASRHAITELMSWISLMENIIEEDQDKIMGAVGSEVVQNFLQKYKVQNSPGKSDTSQIPFHTSSHPVLSVCGRVSASI